MKSMFGKFAIACAAAALYLGAAGLSTVAEAQQKGTLRIWINGDKGYNGLQKIGDEFTKKTGVKVVVEHPQDAPTKFQQQAAAGKGPDIFIWAHDRAGEWAVSGLLEPLRPSPKIKNQFVKVGWDAWTLDGKTWGYPISVEAIALIYNKALIKRPPRTFEEIFKLDKQLQKKGKKALLWDYNNTYFTWPLLAAGGGYPFKRDAKGNYNDKDSGVNNRGAVAGASMLLRLIKEGVMPKGASYSTMESAMIKGELGMMISGAWAWDNLKKNKIDFGVAPIPSVGGKKSSPFIGVQGAMINASSPNKDVAKEFIEGYMLTLAGLQTIDSDVPLGVPAHKGLYRKLSKNPHIRATMNSIKSGRPMPNNPAMGRFWSAMASALENITNERQSPKEALDAAHKRIMN